MQTTTPISNHSVFLQAGCPSWCPTNSVKALKENVKAQWDWNMYTGHCRRSVGSLPSGFRVLPLVLARRHPLMRSSLWSWHGVPLWGRQAATSCRGELVMLEHCHCGEFRRWSLVLAPVLAFAPSLVDVTRGAPHGTAGLWIRACVAGRHYSAFCRGIISLTLRDPTKANDPLAPHTHTNTHTHRFMALLDFVRYYTGELAPER